MARSIVDELFDRLIRTFPPDRNYGHDDLTAPPMPASVAHFLKQLLRQRLDVEMRNLRDARSSWVDAHHPEVRQAEETLRSALAAHLHVPAAEWEEILRRAVQRVTAYLIHPTQTMTRFVFGNQDGDLSASVIRDRVRFFSTYPYLRDAIDAYLDRDGTTSIDRDRFEALLTRIDERIVADYDADDWMRLLDPLFTLMDLTEQRGVPVSFLQTFFQSKNATAIVQRLHADSLEHGTTVLDRADLRRLIAAASPSSGDSVPTGTATPPTPSASSNADAAAPNGAATRDGAASEAPTDEHEPDGPTPLWKRFQRSDPAPEQQTPVAESLPEDADEPLWTRFRPATEPANASPASPPPPDDLTDLERAVLGERGRRHRDLFIRELFEGARNEYADTLRRLRDAPNWTRASQIIAQDVFRAHRVNIYSKPAVTFTNAVEDRFRRRA